MPHFSKNSLAKLETVEGDLSNIFNEVIKTFDCTIICGHRTEVQQNDAYHAGFSKLKWPESKHNSLPSCAIDVAPYPIDWNDNERFYFFGGYVFQVADRMGIALRWGGDWDGDRDFHDQTFMDLVHYEIERVTL